MIHPLTIVLPLHNAERFVEKCVQEILDETQSFDRSISLVLVDDGSTDDTYEASRRLSRCFPQVLALQQTVRSGLGAAVELVRKKTTADRILIHDGVSPICASQLIQMLQSRQDQAEDRFSGLPRKPAFEAQGSRRFAAVSALNNSLSRSHRPILGFQWLQLTESVPAGRRNVAKISSTSDQVYSPVIPLTSASNLTDMLPNSVV